MKYVAATIYCFLICCKLTYAQNTSVFTPMPVVIFEDNFLNDSTGAFPKQWRIMARDSADYKKLCSVRYVNGRKALVIEGMHSDWLKLTPSREPGPRMRSASYLPGKFTLEYDFLMGKASTMAVNFYATNFAGIFNIMLLDNKHNNSGNTCIKAGVEGPSDPHVYIDPFNYNVWHHLTVSYEARRATVYLDGKKEFTTPVVDRDPLKFQLGYDPYGTIAFTNFRLATDSSSVETNFNHLLTEDTFATHAILFETNKATIQEKSNSFMEQLAAWLAQNPGIKLEIDGHTDNDGDATYNLKLSKERADAVKAMLVSLGIKAERLTTKGYGDTKPIRSNATEEGKAENRRVEFINKK